MDKASGKQRTTSTKEDGKITFRKAKAFPLIKTKIIIMAGSKVGKSMEMGCILCVMGGK
jgi:hypothetical protein